MNVTDRIPLRIANTLLNSLKGGVVPRTGLGYITVGRKDEIDHFALLLGNTELVRVFCYRLFVTMLWKGAS